MPKKKEYFKSYEHKPPKKGATAAGRKKGYRDKRKGFTLEQIAAQVHLKVNPVGRPPKHIAQEKLKQEQQKILNIINNFWRF